MVLLLLPYSTLCNSDKFVPFTPRYGLPFLASAPLPIPGIQRFIRTIATFTAVRVAFVLAASSDSCGCQAAATAG